MTLLDLDAVRKAAREERLAEVQHNTTSRVIAFKTASGDRINVWYTTGTVGTYLEHPRQGRTQLFRRNVDTSLLREIFRKPRVHTSLGYHFRDEQPTAAPQGRAASSRRPNIHPHLDQSVPPRTPDCGNRSRSRERRREGPEADAATVSAADNSSKTSNSSNVVAQNAEQTGGDEVDEEAAAKAQLEKLEKEREDLDREIAGVQAIVDDFEKKREEEKRKKEAEEAKEKAEEEARRQRKAQEEEAARKREAQQAKKAERGEHMLVWASDKSAELAIDDEWYCAVQCESEFSCVAICDAGTYVLINEAERELSFSGGLPLDLDNLLRNRPQDHPWPRYVALGSHSRYYCELQNGKSRWSGPQSLHDELNNTTRSIKSLAFGEDWETWFIVYTDGGWSSAGSVPCELTDTICNRRNRKADLQFVSLGPENNYFLRCGNGRRFWSVTPWISKELNKKGQNCIQSVLFGADTETCFVRGNW
eukprot:g7521.t1